MVMEMFYILTVLYSDRFKLGSISNTTVTFPFRNSAFNFYFHIKLEECFNNFCFCSSPRSPGYFKYYNPILNQFTFTALFALNQ